MAGQLTANQVAVLVIIYDRQEAGLTMVRTADIAAELGTSPEGVGQTTGSLVRRGCLVRERRGGRVSFRLTVRGEAVAVPASRAAGRGEAQL